MKKKFEFSRDFKVNFSSQYPSSSNILLEPTGYSCGVAEMEGVRSIKSAYDCELAVLDICERSEELGMFNPDTGRIYPFIVFSDKVIGVTGGRKLRNFIIKYGLGKVKTSSIGFNPSSGNSIEFFVWETDKKNLFSWYKQALKIAKISNYK